MKTLPHIAFELFRMWSKCAAKLNPGLKLIIVDESLLVEDLKDAISEGIESLNQRSNELRKSEGYDHEFLVGFIQGNLDVKWKYDYLGRNSGEYRSLTACKAIMAYLRNDQNSWSVIKDIYLTLIKKDSNLDNINETIVEKPCSFMPSQQLEFYDKPDKDNPVFIYLDNQINEHILQVMKSIDQRIMPDLRDFFDYDFIQTVVNRGGV